MYWSKAARPSRYCMCDRAKQGGIPSLSTQTYKVADCGIVILTLNHALGYSFELHRSDPIMFYGGEMMVTSEMPILMIMFGLVCKQAP